MFTLRLPVLNLKCAPETSCCAISDVEQIDTCTSCVSYELHLYKSNFKANLKLMNLQPVCEPNAFPPMISREGIK